MKAKQPIARVFVMCLAATWLAGSIPALASEDAEHFVPGEVHVGLSWDNITAMESGELRFGGSFGIHIVHGVEVGFEQQFILPPDQGSHAKSYGYLRYIPFTRWVVAPFLETRAGFQALPGSDGAAFGAAVGATYFASQNLAFEGRVYFQTVMLGTGVRQSQSEFDWRVVLYF